MSEDIDRDYSFMQNNASVHKARPAWEYLEARVVEAISWPACLPDLNHVENVWSMMNYYI